MYHCVELANPIEVSTAKVPFQRGEHLYQTLPLGN
jgi:hypothetical protein